MDAAIGDDEALTIVRVRAVQLFFLAVALLGGAGPVLAQADGLLKVTDAFRLTATNAASGTLTLHWQIADHYYLYRGRVHVKATGHAITVGAPSLPDGLKEHDPYLGDVEIYHHALTATVPYTVRDPAATEMHLDVQFQGCHEVDPKICYPPHTAHLTLPIRASATIATGAPPLAAPPGPSRFFGSPLSAPAAASTAALATPAVTTPGNGAPGAGAGPAAGRGAAAALPATPNATSALLGPSAVQTLAGSLGGNGRWLALLGFFAAGLALAFTPCVLPMIPILSGLVAGAGTRLSTRRAFALSVVYVLASSVVFVIAGVIAGLIGASVQAAFQSPWLLGSFALLFVLLALSMFGFYELKPPAALQKRVTAASNRQQGGSLTGVAVMGVLSALIVGPCVAPPLAGAVLYIAQSHDPAFGALALFLLSVGMGVPLVVFGTVAGRWLPRAGAWMKTVQAVFGVIFLGLAIWMVSRFLAPVWIMLMTGVLLIGCAVYMGAFDRLAQGMPGWRRLWKAGGLVLLVLGAAELVGTAAGSRSLLRPLAVLTGGSANMAGAPIPAFQRVATVADLRQSLAAAQAAGKPVMMDFYADWCVSCKEMEHRTFTQPAVRAALSHFVLLQADVTANSDADRALLKHYGLFGPPATIFYDTEGRQLTGLRLVGFENAAAFIVRLDKAQQG